ILPTMNVQPTVVTQPQTVVVVQPKTNHWQTDLCDCFSDCGVCKDPSVGIASLWGVSPLVLSAKSREISEEGNKWRYSRRLHPKLLWTSTFVLFSIRILRSKK
ncbi:hypothetical protein Chor_001193, partial [Crotalus horridus]